MRFSEIFAENLLIRWLTGRSGGEALAVAMTGVKLGERVLVAGCSDARLLAALGARAGLTGHLCGVDVDRDAATRAERKATREGVLVEILAVQAFSAIPGDTGTFDLTVADTGGSLADPSRLEEALPELLRLLRPGGRCVVVGHAAQAPPALNPSLRKHGFRAARVLAERAGWWFVEATKAR
jgi:SAM-dependent methyltransferase